MIDFKTSRHEGGNLDAFLDEELARYRPQLERNVALARVLGVAGRVQHATSGPLRGHRPGLVGLDAVMGWLPDHGRWGGCPSE